MRGIVFAVLGMLLVRCGGGGGNVTPTVAGPTPPPLAADGSVIAWDDALLQAEAQTKSAPTVVARALAEMHTAMYDAWAAYDATAAGTMYGTQLRRPEGERRYDNKRHAIAIAAYRVLVDLFPTQQSIFDATIAQQGYDPRDTSTDRSTPAGIGNVAAAAVINWRHHDGANQLGDLAAGAYADYTGYTPVNTPDRVNDPNHWQPLAVPAPGGGTVAQKFTTAQWYRVKPFALTRGSQLRPPPPPQYGSAEFARQTQQILDYSANLTDEQKSIAEYWKDGPNSATPPGHWCLWGDFVSKRDHHTLDQDVKMLFALGNAELDTSIAVWDAKRAYDFVRPITAVHVLFAGQYVTAWAGPNKGTGRIRAEDWHPYQPLELLTPSFPEYVSGHSGFSAAGAEILKDFTGSDAMGASFVVPAHSSAVESGTPAQNVTLSWATFSEAAEQAALSRRYGGIHFESGDLEARKIGRAVGQLVWAKAQRLFSGQTQ